MLDRGVPSADRRPRDSVERDWILPRFVLVSPLPDAMPNLHAVPLVNRDVMGRTTGLLPCPHLPCFALGEAAVTPWSPGVVGKGPGDSTEHGVKVWVLDRNAVARDIVSGELLTGVPASSIADLQHPL